MTKKGVRPGFSLMDWNRKRIDCKMTGTVSLDELRRHATSNDAWTVYEGQVYAHLEATARRPSKRPTAGSTATRSWASAAWGLWRAHRLYLLKRRTRTTRVTQQLFKRAP